MVTKIILTILTFFSNLFACFQNKKSLPTVVAEQSEEMQKDIAQKETTKPQSQSDILKRLSDHDA